MKSEIVWREVTDRNLLKERQKDDAMYEGKEKFVTAAYKRKLEADRKWLDEVRERELKGRSSKSSFLTHMIDSRADEAEDGKQESISKEAASVPKEAASTLNKPSSTEKPPQVEEEDEFDGFIMAPEEDQIKGNVDSDDAGLIMAPSETRRSRSRSRSRSRHHHQHRHHRHSCVFNKQTMLQITVSHQS